MAKVEKFLDKYGCWLAFFLALPAVWSLLIPGYFGASDDMHPAWLFEMDRALKAGIFPPRFVPDLSFGFGYPLFNFVFPFPFYLGEIFHLVGFSLVGSIKAVFFLGLPLSVVFMFLFLKRVTKPSLSLAGALIYGYFPYRSTEIFVRGDIGEATAFVFFPLILLCICELADDNRTEKKCFFVGLGGVAVALLVLTHNIAAYMFLPFACLLSLFFLISTKKARLEKLSNLFLMFFLGLMGSIYFWLPALFQSSLMKYDTVYNFQDYFLPLKRMITPYFGYGGFPTMSFFLGYSALFSIVAGLVVGFSQWQKLNRKERVIFLWGITVLAVSLLMTNIRSAFLWSKIPFLPYFQFPWRFLIMVVSVTPLFLLPFGRLKLATPVGLGLAIFSVVTTVGWFRPQDFLGRTDEYYLNRYIPFPVAAPEYKEQNEEYLRLPKTAESRPDRNYPLVFTQENGIKEIREITALRTIIYTDSPKSFVLNYTKYYFPGWFAKIDGNYVLIKAGKPYGQIILTVPEGRHTVEIFYRETKLNLILDIISAFSVGILIYFLVKKI